MLRVRFAFCCIALASFGAPGVACAYSACVGTAAELDAAFAQATATADASITIRIREGTYVAGAGLGFYLTLTHSNQTATISGGWSGAACENRRLGAGSGTTLVGSTTVSALQLNGGFGTTGNTINATDLTLRNDAGLMNEAVGACLNVLLNTGATARIYRMRLDGCVGSSAAILDNASGDLTLANSVVAGGFNSGAPVLSLNNNATTRLAFLSVTGNTATSSGQPASGLKVFASPSPPSTITLDNSVVWGGIAPQGIPDIATDGPGITFTRAHYEARSALNAAITDTMPGHGDPGFVSSTNARLRNDSPLVDSGVMLSIGGSYDADGQTRTQGAAVDVGAFEANPDRLFADAFDA